MTRAAADISVQSSMSKRITTPTSSSRARAPRARPRRCVSRAQVCACSIVERVRAAAAETVRRRDQHARAVALPVAAGTAPARFRPSRSRACISKARRATCSACTLERAGGDSDPPHRVRSPARRAGARGGRRAARAGAGRAGRAGSTTASRCARATDASCARRWSIAADGVNSVIARRLGMNPGWPPAQARARHDGGDASRGDCARRSPRRCRCSMATAARTATPTSSRSANTSTSASATCCRISRRRSIVTPYDLQRQFVGDLRARGMMDGESQRAHFTPFLIPIGGPLRTTAQGRVLLAGDAGGFVNGFSAEGIYYAMVTGELAAAAIVQATRTGVVDPAAAPARATCAPGGTRSAVSCATRCSSRSTCSTARRAWTASSAARPQRPEFSEILVDYASGRLSYRAARRRLLWHFPRLLPQLAWQALRATGARMSSASRSTWRTPGMTDPGVAGLCCAAPSSSISTTRSSTTAARPAPRCGGAPRPRAPASISTPSSSITRRHPRGDAPRGAGRPHRARRCAARAVPARLRGARHRAGRRRTSTPSPRPTAAAT